MGFYIRKSINLGPFRLNLSKSGIGISVGVKGLRVSTGPQGTYVHMGRHGLYYRQRIGGTGQRRGTTSPRDLHTIETVDVGNLIEFSNEETLSQINARAQQTVFWPFVAVGTALLTLSILPVAGIFAPFPLAIGLVCTWMVYQGDKLKRTTPLFYELEEDAAHRFIAIQRSCENLARSERIWRVEAQADAASLILRRPITVGRLNPPFIATNVDIWGIDMGVLKLFFFPDYLFVFQQGLYGVVSYNSLVVRYLPTRFVERERVPQDAEIIDYTWQHVRKDGSPDRRFTNNPRIPVALYGLLEITSAAGLNIYLYISNKSLAMQFSEALSHVWPQAPREEPHQGSTEQKTEQEEAQPHERDTGNRWAYEILGIDVDASPDEIKAAYHRMAQTYHPDKVANLAPEFRELAERRMKEINAAYEALKPDHPQATGRRTEQEAPKDPIKSAQGTPWEIRSNAGMEAFGQGRYAEAERLLKTALKEAEGFGPRDERLATSLDNLARLCKAQGKYVEAERFFRRALAIKEQALGPKHPSVAMSLNNLADLRQVQGRYAEAEQLLRRSLGIAEEATGAEDSDVATLLSNLATACGAQGKYTEAERLFRRSLAIDKKALGAEHPNVAASLNNLASLYDAQRRHAEAEQLLRQSLGILEKSLGPEHPMVAASLNNLASFCNIQGKHVEAERLFRRSLAINEKTLGPGHPHIAMSRISLAGLCYAQGRYAEAEQLFQQSLETLERALGSEHPNVAIGFNNLANFRKAQGRYTEAEQLFKRALVIGEKALGPNHPEVALFLENYAALLRRTQRGAEAAKMTARALKIRSEHHSA